MEKETIKDHFLKILRYQEEMLAIVNNNRYLITNLTKKLHENGVLTKEDVDNITKEVKINIFSSSRKKKRRKAKK